MGVGIIIMSLSIGQRNVFLKSLSIKENSVCFFDDESDMNITNDVIEESVRKTFRRPYIESSDDDYEYFFCSGNLDKYSYGTSWGSTHIC